MVSLCVLDRFFAWIRCRAYVARLLLPTKALIPSSDLHTMKNSQSLTDVPFMNDDLFVYLLVVSVDTSEKPGRR